MEIVYLEGDCNAPKYLRGALERGGHHVRLASLRAPLDLGAARVVIVSDVPADLLGDDAARRIAAAVTDGGVGLLLVGGWHAFGRGGWGRSALGCVAPVSFEDGDDRVNTPSGLFLLRSAHHPAIDGLPWDNPPVLTGYNRAVPLAGARVVLHGAPVDLVSDEVVSIAHDHVPLLAVHEIGAGRVAAFASDLTPHWSGGLTDWGGSPVDVGEGEEVGAGYVRFLDQLCAWLGEERDAGGRGETVTKAPAEVPA